MTGAWLEPAVMDSFAADLERLARKLRGLAEPAMRREVVYAVLVERTPEEGYFLLHTVLHNGAQRGTTYDLLRETMQEVLLLGGASALVPYDWLSAVYRHASSRDDELVMRMLRSPPSAQTFDNPSSAMHRAVAEIPLGRRRWLAKTNDRTLLEKLMVDPDPIVIHNLLRNPRLTESEVLRIASRRPISASTLQEIFICPRWANRERVRTALARNPYCPTRIALRLLATLPLTVLREMRRDGVLHAEILRQIDAEIGRRRGDPPPIDLAAYEH